MDSLQIGEEMHRWSAELFPICRSITGNGVRETLRLIQKRIPLTINEVPSGMKVFDWTVPLEWDNIQDAYIKNLRGDRLVDFRKSNLHVVSYSRPVKQRLALAELKQHLFTIPDRPDWIPYRTSYYKESWGFCLSHNQFNQLQDEEYDVYIDASLTEGHLTYGEYCLPGQVQDEVLVSAHICHPSLCNDNLSGIAVATFLGGVARLATATLLLSIPVYTGNHRIHHMVEPTSATGFTHQARAGVDRGWGCRLLYLQKKPSRRRGNRSGNGPCAQTFRPKLITSSTLFPMAMTSGSIVLQDLTSLSDVSAEARTANIPNITLRPTTWTS